MRSRLLQLLLTLSLAASVQAVLAQDDMSPEAGDEQGAEALAESAPADSEYLEFKPAFVTNYGGPGPLHYLKADIVVRVTGGERGTTAVRRHMPQLRHQVVMLLSRQEAEDIATMEGKELLRQQALAAVREVLEREEGRPFIEDLLFNNFIIQR